MKKVMFGLLLLSGNLFAMDSEKLSLKDKECCDLVSRALMCAHVGLYFRYDNNFPKRISQVEMHGDIPASFTAEKAKNCGCYKSHVKDKPQVGDIITIVPSTQGKQGSVTAHLERADFDTLTEEIENKKMSDRFKRFERIFDYYNIDQR